MAYSEDDEDRIGSEMVPYTETTAFSQTAALLDTDPEAAMFPANPVGYKPYG